MTRPSGERDTPAETEEKEREREKVEEEHMKEVEVEGLVEKPGVECVESGDETNRRWSIKRKRWSR